VTVDFDLDESSQELRTLAAEILDREVTQARLEAHERDGTPYDEKLWKALADAGIVGACLPEDLGGSGLGPTELAVIMRELSAHAAPVPAFAVIPAAMTVARHGTAEQRKVLTDVAEGRAIITTAVRDPGAPTTARRDGDGYVLDGVKTFVSHADQATYVLVPAQTEEGREVFLVEPGRTTLTDQPSSTGEPTFRIGLDNVRAEAPLKDAAQTLERLIIAAATAAISGALDAAMRLTTEHVRTRRQFDRVLAEFQAVTMQVGDVYIAKRALEVALWAAVWRLEEGEKDTDEALAIAAWTACDGAVDALYTCQHLHGGLGVDITYPLHRYFTLVKHYAYLLGGAESWLETIGAQCSST
jgi:alkylation response protein AidB-like acyl-CoA dehydrogenase